MFCIPSILTSTFVILNTIYRVTRGLTEIIKSIYLREQYKTDSDETAASENRSCNRADIGNFK